MLQIVKNASERKDDDECAADTDDRLESIAQDIEQLQSAAILQIAERLAEARDVFRHRRDEGGFGGWVENRLSISRATAYNLINVHKLAGTEGVQGLDKSPFRRFTCSRPRRPPNRYAMRSSPAPRTARSSHIRWSRPPSRRPSRPSNRVPRSRRRCRREGAHIEDAKTGTDGAITADVRVENAIVAYTLAALQKRFGDEPRSRRRRRRPSRAMILVQTVRPSSRASAP